MLLWIGDEMTYVFRAKDKTYISNMLTLLSRYSIDPLVDMKTKNVIFDLFLPRDKDKIEHLYKSYYNVSITIERVN